jgi:hypothetical protein
MNSNPQNAQRSAKLDWPPKRTFAGTVLVADLLIYLPATYYFCRPLKPSGMFAPMLLLLLLQPTLVLVDHGR